MTALSDLSPLAEARARATITIIAEALAKGAAGLTYSDLSRQLGMSKVNGQGLRQYLIRAAAICAENGWPNLAVMVGSKDSVDKGAPVPSDGTLSDAFFTATGLTESDIPTVQAAVRAFDWSAIRLSDSHD